MPGQLPKIAWETSKVVEEKAPAEEIEDKTDDSVTVVVTKRPKKVHLDVFDRAAESKKPVMLYFTAQSCETCRTMEKLLLRQGAVVKEVKAFHPVQIATDFVDKELLKKYQVRQAPTIVLFDASGKRRAYMVGRQEPGRLVATLRKVSAENARRVEQEREAEERRKREEARKAEAETSQEETNQEKEKEKP